MLYKYNNSVIVGVNNVQYCAKALSVYKDDSKNNKITSFYLK